MVKTSYARPSSLEVLADLFNPYIIRWGVLTMAHVSHTRNCHCKPQRRLSTELLQRPALCLVIRGTCNQTMTVLITKITTWATLRKGAYKWFTTLLMALLQLLWTSKYRHYAGCYTRAPDGTQGRHCILVPRSKF